MIHHMWITHTGGSPIIGGSPITGDHPSQEDHPSQRNHPSQGITYHRGSPITGGATITATPKGYISQHPPKIIRIFQPAFHIHCLWVSKCETKGLWTPLTAARMHMGGTEHTNMNWMFVLFVKSISASNIIGAYYQTWQEWSWAGREAKRGYNAPSLFSCLETGPHSLVGPWTTYSRLVSTWALPASASWFQRLAPCLASWCSFLIPGWMVLPDGQ